ncbi:hypothetical protein Hanom_Chr01g00034731 [Helianthus anomalus]
MEENLDKLSLDVIVEMRKRVYVCLAAKNVMKYDIKRGCYIDENMNPLDFTKFFCAGTYKTETKKIPKNEESEKLVSLNLEPVLKKEVVENAPIFDHSSDEDSDDEDVQVEKKQVEKILALKVEKKADDKQRWLFRTKSKMAISYEIACGYFVRNQMPIYRCLIVSFRTKN